MNPTDRFRAELSDGTLELQLLGTVGSDPFFDGLGAETVAAALKDAGDVKTIRLRINSPGGDVFEGFAIYNLLSQHPARVEVEVDGLAASSASVIAMAGDQITMAENAMIMVHDPWSIVVGSAEDHRDSAARLDKLTGSIAGIYSARTGISKDEVLKMMSDETWLDANEAKAKGFANSITPNKSSNDGNAKNSLDLKLFGKPAHAFRNAPVEKLAALGFKLVPEAAQPVATEPARPATLGDLLREIEAMTPEQRDEHDRASKRYLGKAYEELAPREKHVLWRDQTERYRTMRDDWVARGSPIQAEPKTIYDAIDELVRVGGVDLSEREAPKPKLELVPSEAPS